VRKVQKYVDQVLCSLPFEPAWYQGRGVTDAVYVGHPYFDELAARPLDDGFLMEHRGRPGPMVAILPGSRTQEVKRNLPDMIRAAWELSRRRPDVRFAVACLHERHKAMAERIIAEVGAQAEGSGTSGKPSAIEVFAARTPELIRLARVAWAVSGSVGLELMADGLPSVVLYKVQRFDLWVARWFIKSKYISLVNLLADEEVFPEYLTWRDASGDLVRWALAWLDEGEERARTTLALDALRRRVAHPGATDRAAERIVARLARRREPAAAAAQPAASIAYRGPHDPGARQPATGERGQPQR
jgi:lipid-A-disaccharide synthase